MTGASGVGKDTIRNAAMPHIQQLQFSISATTRARRHGEQDGVQYYFLQRDKFEAMIQDDLFLEYADFVGEYYGTPLEPVKQALAQGRDVLLELELVGARQVKRRMPQAVMIFIAPPSLNELERRLRGRGTESEQKIEGRLARAREEIRALREFDYLIVNDDVAEAAALFRCIIRAERSRARLLSQQRVEEFLHEDS
jgi:guanylate kinase